MRISNIIIRDGIEKARNSSTGCLKLSKCIGDESIMELVAVLGDPNYNFTSLNFMNTDKSVRALAVALRHPNCKLISLDLIGHTIKTEGVRELAAALKHPNCKLISLNLNCNKVSYEDADEIRISLKNNYRILNIENTEMSAGFYIRRNQELFINNCNKVLTGRRLSTKAEAMVLDQCKTLIEYRNYSEEKINISGIEEATIQNVINKLSAKFYTKLLGNQLPGMPITLCDIMGEYCTEGSVPMGEDYYNLLVKEEYKNFLTRTAISVVPVMLSSLPILCAYPAVALVTISSTCLLLKNFSSLYDRLEEGLERQDGANLNLYKLKISAPIMLALPALYTFCGMYSMAALTTLSTVPCLISVLNLDDSPKMPTVVKNLYRNCSEIVGIIIEKSGFIDRYKSGNNNLSQLALELG